MSNTNPRERLVSHVQELERLQDLKKRAADDLKAGFEDAAAAGFDTSTLKAVLKLRKLTPNQRAERRALEAIYLAALGMLEGDPLPNEARRRLDEDRAPSAPHEPSGPSASRVPRKDEEPGEPAPHQPPLESSVTTNTSAGRAMGMVRWTAKSAREPARSRAAA